MYKKGKKNKKVSTLELYTSLLINIIHNGTMDKKKSLGDDKLQIEFQKVYSKNTAKEYFFVKAFPSDIAYSFMQVIREYCKNPSVRINFISHMKYHTINWDSNDMKFKREQWGNYIEERRNQPPGTVLETDSDRKLTDRERWLIDSWAYALDLAENSQGLILSDFIIEFCSKTNTSSDIKQLDKSIAKFKDFSVRNKIQVIQVKNYLYNFLKFISPMYVPALDGDKYLNVGEKFISTRVIGDETFADMTTYTPGKLTDKGTLLGVDVSTGMMVYKNFKRSTADAENFLVSAITGGGKSAMVKFLIFQMLASYYVCIVLDRDGEYIPLSESINGVVINLNKSSGIYFDSMKIGDTTGIEAIDSTLYLDAISGTVGVFNILSNMKKGMSTNERAILNTAYNNLLSEYGVLANNPSTWKNSDKLNYHLLYQEIKRLSYLPNYRERYGNEILDFVDNLKVYFEPDGLHSYLFKTPITLSDITNSATTPFIDIVMNLTDTGTGTEGDRIDDNLKQMTAAYLTINLTNYYRAQERFSAHFVEEYQRYTAQDATQQTITAMITGNRKRNAITFILTNSPAALMESNTKESRDILENTNNVLLGKLSPGTIDMLCKAFQLEDSKKILYRMSEKEKEFKYCFLAKLNNNEVCVLKAPIPPKLAESKIFATRTTEESKSNEKTTKKISL